MLVIGAHLTISKGFTNAAKTAVEIGGNTFQFFSRNPRGGNAKDYDEKDIKTFQEIRKNKNFGPIMAHAPYTLNLASTKEDVYEFSKRTIKEDIERMDSLGIEFYNFHPGSHVGEGIDYGIDRIINGINQGIKGDESITILLETMSGKGSEIGFKFEHLKRIIDGVEYHEKLGVCLDLCHIFSAGYDIVGNLDGVIEEFDHVIGIQRLKAIHLNDSLMPFGSNKDRHAAIGEGLIGLDSILNFMKHSRIAGLPFYLETPLEDVGHSLEIKMLREKLI